MYWAEALAAQPDDRALAARMQTVHEALVANEDAIIAELNGVQGVAMDIGGYYAPDEALAAAAMRPSPVLNAIIDGV